MSRSDQPPARRVAGPHPAIPGFHIVECIGRGSTGTVFRAVQLSLRREVALKVLPADLAGRPGFAERFLLEARAAGAVHHPNVLTCYDAGEAEGTIYQALELMTGGDLAQYLHSRGGKLPFKEALLLGVECAKGLDGIHRAGMVHGDLKPTNVFIAEDNGALVIKLGDLGMARSLAGSGVWDAEAIASNATIAPELLDHGGPADIRTDIYALGAILYLLATGKPPYVAPSREELARILRHDNLPDPCALDPSLPTTLAAVVARAIARDPADRYPVPAQLREDLERLHFDFVPIHARLSDDSTRSFAKASGERRATGTIRRGLSAASATQPAIPTARPASSARNPQPAVQADTIRRGPPWAIIGGSALIAIIVILALVFAFTGHDQPRQPAIVAPPADTPTSAVPAKVHPGPPPAPTWARPAWARAHGEDASGRWADLHVNQVVQRFRYCPAGTFRMGSPNDEAGRHDDETPFQVTLGRAFWLADSEATQALWETVTGAAARNRHAGPGLPVENVSWNDCQDFLRRLNARLDSRTAFRLPTEAEWEYAARAGGAAGAWTEANAAGNPHPVKTLAANAWGLYDLGGNVMEWCQDHYGPYPTQPATDPIGYAGVHRIARGGAWSAGVLEARPAARTRYLPVARYSFLGFRLAISDGD